MLGVIFEDLFLPTLLWSLVYAAVGFVIGLISFFVIRLFKGYNFSFKFSKLIKFLILIYSCCIASGGLFFYGALKGISSGIETTLEMEETRELLLSSLSAGITKSIGAVYILGQDYTEHEEITVTTDDLLDGVDSFESGKWGIDIEAISMITHVLSGEAYYEHREKIFNAVFPGEDTEVQRWLLDFVAKKYIEKAQQEASLLITVGELVRDIKAQNPETPTPNILHANEITNYYKGWLAVYLNGKIATIIRFEQYKTLVMTFLLLLVPSVVASITVFAIKKFAASKDESINPELNEGYQS